MLINSLIIFVSFNLILLIFVGLMWIWTKEDGIWDSPNINWEYVLKYESVIIVGSLIFGFLLISDLKNNPFLFILISVIVVLAMKFVLNRISLNK